MQVLFDAIHETTSVGTEISKKRRPEVARKCLVLRRVMHDTFENFLETLELRSGWREEPFSRLGALPGAQSLRTRALLRLTAFRIEPQTIARAGPCEE